MSNPSRPARTRYPFLLPKADSLNKISTAITLDPDWKVSRKLSLWIKPELLQACKVHSPKQKAKTGIFATMRKEVLASWSLIWDVLKFREVLEVPPFSPWASQDVASHVDGRFFCLNWAIDFKYGRKLLSAPLCYLYAYNHMVWEITEILPRRWMFI